jgi:hypothetical protein
MEEVRLRLIYPSHMKKETTGAAFRGVERLASFGVLCEKGDESEQMWDVKAGSRIMEIVRSQAPAIVGRYHLEEGLIDLITDTTVIGVGITDQPIFSIEEYTSKQVIGMSAGPVGAIVSLAGFDDPVPRGVPYRSGMAEIGIDSKAVELAVARAAGRIFIPHSDRLYRGNCRAQECIMQEFRSAMQLMEKVARGRLDICISCESDIQRTVDLMQRPY